MTASHTSRRSSFIGTISRVASAAYSFLNISNPAAALTMTPFEAVEELKRRQRDPELKKKVEEYLKGDIPEYFKDGPVLYLARHIVTPNFETLRFIQLMDHMGLKTVVTQDSKGLFVTQNHVKKALAKLPILRRHIQKGKKLHEHYENLTIVNFNEADGKKFSDIKTVWGEKLTDFHNRLFSELLTRKIESPDDAEWIDRHHRDNLLVHYKHLLSLFVVHGIFFENYDLNDAHELEFIRTVLKPACSFVKERFGYQPIIVQIFHTSFESYHFWISYPKKVLDIVKKSMKNRVV